MKESKTLSERINTVSVNDYLLFRRDVLTSIKVSTATWSNWKRGKTEPSYSEGLVIDKILSDYGY